jgi:hypothetical protein
MWIDSSSSRFLSGADAVRGERDSKYVVMQPAEECRMGFLSQSEVLLWALLAAEAELSLLKSIIIFSRFGNL